ncbi:hypothetical protein [Candidatus Hodgkinia cicadicola]
MGVVNICVSDIDGLNNSNSVCLGLTKCFKPPMSDLLIHQWQRC